jgi:transposase
MMTMYFRLKKTKSTPVLQLVESYRDPEGRPRQRILLSLGNAKMKKEIWQEVLDAIENHMNGIQTLIKPSKEVAKWTETILGELQKTNNPLQTIDKPSDTTINTESITHCDTTELGPLLPVMQAWEELNFPSILCKAGLNHSQIRDASLSIMNRLLDPCTENSLLSWVKTTSFADLFGEPIRQNNKDRFYRVTDLLYGCKEEIEKELRHQEESFFNLEKTILLYDLTNTYFEGRCLRNPKAKRGNSKEQRFDAPLLSVGLVMDSEGFVIRHEIFSGNTHDSATLLPMIHQLKKDQEHPLIILDSGLASENNLKELRENGFDYIVVGKRPARIAYEKEFLTLPFKKLEGREGKPSVQIAMKDEEQERILFCYSEAKKEKEKAILSQAESRYLKDLEKLKTRLEKGRLKKISSAQKALGRLLERHPRVTRYYEVHLDEKTLSLRWDRQNEKYETALNVTGGYYLRSSRKDLDDQTIWHLYITLTRVESGFKALKSNLGLRPVFHHREDRCESHIFITILAYRLLHHIEYKLRSAGETKSWTTIKRLLRTHAYTTISLTSQNHTRIHLRIPGTPDFEQKRIYDLLGVKYRALPRRALRSK